MMFYSAYKLGTKISRSKYEMIISFQVSVSSRKVLENHQKCSLSCRRHKHQEFPILSVQSITTDRC